MPGIMLAFSAASRKRFSLLSKHKPSQLYPDYLTLTDGKYGCGLSSSFLCVLQKVSNLTDNIFQEVNYDTHSGEALHCCSFNCCV